MGYQFRDLIEAMYADTGIDITELRVDGGAANNDFLLQFQADQLDVTVQRPVVVESTARGAAFLAGLATGFWASQDELRDAVEIEHSFTSTMDPSTRDRLYAGWKKAVSRSLDWEEH
jgi:glycerol kinase